MRISDWSSDVCSSDLERDEQIQEAGPATPVEVLGLNGTPLAGDDFTVVENEGRAREIAEYRQRSRREKEFAATGRGTLEQMMSRIKEGEASELPVVVKSDVHGSMEAIVSSLEKLATDDVNVRVLQDRKRVVKGKRVSGREDPG